MVPRTKHAVIFALLALGVLAGVVLTLVVENARGGQVHTDTVSFATPKGNYNAVIATSTPPRERQDLIAKLQNGSTAEGTAPVPDATATATATAPTQTNAFPTGAIPLGDGHVSSAPRAGYVYSCTQNFRTGGADHAGDWIVGDSWYPAKKVTVDGNVIWPSQISFTTEGSTRFVNGNGLPDHRTGNFPIQPSDDAYQYDKNPNSIEPQTIALQLPTSPTIAAAASCVPMGMIGIALDGTAIYNALDDAGRDAVAHEVQDTCDGHPQSAGEYHYHGPSVCMPHVTEDNALVGYALDGFGIYSPYDANGKELTNADLDACHGTTSPVMWNGRTVTMYHYVLTREYPYTLGCFRGTPIKVAPLQSKQQAGTGGNRLPPPGGLPPRQQQLP